MLTFVRSVKRVCIVGAGSSGSSSAFFLSNASKQNNDSLIIDVFEKNPLPGGSKFIFILNLCTLFTYICLKGQLQYTLITIQLIMIQWN